MNLQFQVPQFVEVEDKIFGPFSLKQFIYLAGGAGIVFILYKLLPLFIMLPLGLAVAALSLALAFYKVNERPFVKFLESALKYSMTAKVYRWKMPEAGKKKIIEPQEQPIINPEFSKEKLQDLAWSLNIKEKIR